VSAPSRAELAARLAAYRDLARAADDPAGPPAADLPDLASAATATANQHEHRVAVVAASYPQLAERLEVALAAEPPAADPPPRERGLVFVFAGQGHQWLGMGRELLRHEPAFRAAVDDCDAAVARHADISVREQLELDGQRSRMNEIDVLQPVLFTVQIALARLWADWGVRPDAVVGHSMGEISAAHVAGALTLDDAAMIACRRSRLLRRISGLGALAVTELGPDEAAALAAGTAGRVSVAGFNSPVLSVLAGDVDSLAGIVQRLEEQDVYCKLIRGTVASHSPYVDGLREDLDFALRDLSPRPAALPMYSTVSLERLAGPELAAPYWMRNLREPVRFAEAVAVLREAGHGVFLEISGHPVLSASVSACLEHGGRTGRALHSGRRGAERESMLASLGALYELGWHPDWSRVHQGADGRSATPPTTQAPAAAARPPRRTFAALTAYQAALAGAVLDRPRPGADGWTRVPLTVE
jgi:acyl transferase domain-containing protein